MKNINHELFLSLYIFIIVDDIVTNPSIES